ncbi:MAG: GNAT family N-acetyltransferase [Methanomassiliicoccales archaeon]|nr:GNAT family N-acetyltransferase [Methanomassiliicoccales archaeon]MDD1756512.1 GNAT family N-acetyltransferase [Methanomassiliicoccales archaeon]
MEFVVVSSLTSKQVDDLMGLYQFTYWAQARSREEVDRMLKGRGYLFGAVEAASGRLCAFARVLSDDLFRAVIFDVVVHPDFRGRGLAKMIFDAILSHPVLGRVENVLLFCKDDVVELYERFGFEEYEGMHLMMRKSTSDL